MAKQVLRQLSANLHVPYVTTTSSLDYDVVVHNCHLDFLLQRRNKWNVNKRRKFVVIHRNSTMVRGNRTKRTEKSVSKPKETQIREESAKSEEISRKRKSDASNVQQTDKGFVSKSPNKKQQKTSETTEQSEKDGVDSNNNATISEQEDQNFLKQMDAKFGKRKSEPTKGTTPVADKTKRFSLMDDALRNNPMDLDDPDIRFFSEEEDEDDEPELVERINRKTESEKPVKQRSRSKQRKSPEEKRNKKRESPPQKVDLTSQPEFQLLLRELREVKEQLKEKSKAESPRDRGELELGTGISGIKNTHNTPNQPIKSPSDTTLYAPAVRSGRDLIDTGLVERRIRQVSEERNPIKMPEKSTRNFESEINQILNNIRIGTDKNQQEEKNIQRRLNFDEEEKGEKARMEPDVKQLAKDRILQAEKFRASVEAPKGRDSNPFYVFIENEDDKFLHVTCHIEETIKIKIKKGEFVELEKIIAKEQHAWIRRGTE